MLSGTILIWSGSVASIPSGWFLCNGANGTPNLRKRFIIGAGGSYDPDDTGGDTFHQHAFTSDGHYHNFVPGSGVHYGSPWEPYSKSSVDTGDTDGEDALPPYYNLAYIMLGY